MRFVFRTDASIAQGTGHVMRCATLARALADAGHEVGFLSRECPGDLNGWLEGQGFRVRPLTTASTSVSQQADAGACRAALAGKAYDWLVVDHYELDAAWERGMAAHGSRILAIDDLGRPHDCDMLLDQNYPNPTQRLYRIRTDGAGKLLLGPQFALVRPEFAKLRPASLARRDGALARILVFMGGSDPVDETSKALAGLLLGGPRHLAVDVVIGGTNPHRHKVEAACAAVANATLHVQTPRMAELMATADLALAAGGSATWERCALGLPSLVTILASNQAAIAEAVAAAGAQKLLGWYDEVTANDYAEALAALDTAAIAGMSQKAGAMCDGRGVERLMSVLLAPEGEAILMSDETHA
jgi:UDP-2,4-diacetamido-2,4,6-trideoxy-beta-L-altropyranose hydrolase